MIVAGTFSPSFTGSVGASTLTSNSGFLYSSTRNLPPPWLCDEDLIDAQRGVRGQRELAVEAAVGVGGEVLLEDLFALGIVDLDREGLVGEVGGVGLVVLGMATQNLNCTVCSGR